METTQEPIETKRKYPRVRQELPFSFRVVHPESEENWVSTKTNILGGGGISVISPVLLPVGALLHAKINHYARVIEFTAEIVWAEEVLIGESIQSRCGLRFTQISQDSLLSIHDIINNSQSRPFQQIHQNQIDQ
ncbi:MAG: PilZ domain-containing protein [Nitrospirae bacterium]|nr:PilZ domain-containing protein [Nitrospirota bacterium]MBI3595363.1 PilZ domain-containing protein [Nitrospirota bacterium]